MVCYFAEFEQKGVVIKARGEKILFVRAYTLRYAGKLTIPAYIGFFQSVLSKPE